MNFQPLSTQKTSLLIVAALSLAATVSPARSSTNAEFIFGAFLSSTDSVQNIAGNYASNFPPNNFFTGANPYDFTVAADEKGKLLAQGTINGVTNSDGAVAFLDAKGAMKMQRGMSVASFKSSEKNIFYENLPVKAAGNTMLKLVDTNAQVLKAQGGGQQGAGNTANKGRGAYVFGKKGATNDEFVNAPTNNTAGGKPWNCYFQVYRNEFGHYFATNIFLSYYTYATNSASLVEVQTAYAPERVKYSDKDGSYTVNFYRPTSGDLNAKWSVKKMVPFPTNSPTGAVSYKFLGQGGTSQITNFSYFIATNIPFVVLDETNGVPSDLQ